MIRRLFTIAMACSLLFACQNNQSTSGSEDEVSTEAESQSDQTADSEVEIRIYPKPEIAEFPEASLTLQQPLDGITIDEAGSTVPFDFMVEGYELGTQTTEAGMNLANSDKGQHIHLILDNDPYSAHYEPGFSKEVESGHHYAIAFLSRSYHESVKNPEAYQVFQFGMGTGGAEMIDLDQPALFYSRPKGTYSGEGIEKVLLDFYLHNTELSANGNKVKVIVNDMEEFILDTWQPYIIEGLPLGENKIFIELIDSEGAKVEVPINSISRVFNLEN